MINQNWQKIHNNGCSVEFTTLTGGRAFAYLTRDGKRIGRTEFMSCRRCAKDLLRLAKKTMPGTHQDDALARLAESMSALIAASEAEYLAAVIGSSASVPVRQGARL